MITSENLTSLLQSVLHEIKVTANLQHPHILALHDSGEATLRRVISSCYHAASEASTSSTSGREARPNANEDGSDFGADPVGTWSVVGDTVQFNYAADTFLRDIDFLATRDQLHTDDTIGSL